MRIPPSTPQPGDSDDSIPTDDADESSSPEMGGLQQEIHEYLEGRVVRRRLLPRALLVGLVAGVVASAFRIAIEIADHLRLRAMDLVPDTAFMHLVTAGVIAAVGTAVAFLIGRMDPDAGGSGIPHMKAVLDGHASLRWARLIAVKFGAAVMSIGSGLAMGREGPTVQMTGAAGLAVAKATGSTGRERRALIAAGAGAGLAGAFNAPLAGVTFVLEELQRDFQPVVFGASLLSAAVATVVSRLTAGQRPVFQVPPIEAPPLTYVPIFIVVGVVGGLLGVVFNRGLLSLSQLVGYWRSKSMIGVALGIGGLTGLTYLVSPLLLGGGHELSEAALGNQISLGTAILFLIVRFGIVLCSYSTGVPGGIFAPLLSLGALFGLAICKECQVLPPYHAVGVAACTVAGMCALFSGVVRAPLTGVILIGEMTGSYDLLLPLLIAAFTAYAVAEGLRDTPIYEALMQRDAIRKGWKLEESEPVMAEFEIRAGSAFDGKSLRQLKFPAGAVVVVCKAGGKEFVPSANTELHEHMRIVVAAASAVQLHEIEEGVR